MDDAWGWRRALTVTENFRVSSAILTLSWFMKRPCFSFIGENVSSAVEV